MLISWIALPLVLCALSCGCGLLLERVAGTRLPGALVLPAGLAVIVVGRVTYLKPSRARTLCGRSLDWVEAFKGGS